jgi:hypothetical protein
MADQVLKSVRITDDMKVEVYQQGKKRKYALFYDSDNPDINRRRSDTDNTKSEKYDVAMSDDEVIEMALKAYNSRFGSSDKKYYITQKTYTNPAPVRTYGNGDKSPYYINNGCAINIQWIGKIPNPEFNPGTYSNLYQAERAGRTNGKPRYLENSTITSKTDVADDSSILPKSSWSVSPPIIDDLFGEDLVPVDYRDTSYVTDKVVTVTLPKGSTESGGDKGYLVWTQGGLQYDSKSIPENTPVEQFTGIDRSGYGGRIGRPENQIVYFRNSDKDSKILDRVIEDFKSKVTRLQGTSFSDYDLKLCAPNNEACSLIPYKSPLEAPNNATASQTPTAATQSVPPKIKFTIDGLGGEITLKAKEDLDTFTIWAGPIPKTNNGSGNVDDYEDGLGEEYIETDAVISDEQQIKLDLQIYLTQGDSEGTEDDTSATQTSSGGGVKTSGTNAGGSGDRRFQQQLTIRGRVVKNGEIPSDLLAKVDFGGYLLEKHAAVKFSALNKAFKEKFGKNFTISGPYRPFNVGNNIFDWAYFNKTGKGRKIGTNGGVAAAKPGTSKHGWGQAMDIGGFGNGPGNQYFDWMEQNAKRYGWINPTWAKKPGAGYEPWHWEYIGDDLFAA